MTVLLIETQSWHATPFSNTCLRVGGVSARVSGLRRCLRKDRQQETARIADLERAALPLRVVRVRLERDAGVPGPLGDLVDVTRRRRDGQAHADSLLPVAPLLPIVLV